MTMGEFARKYGVPYADVRSASFRTAMRRNYPGHAYGQDYDELVLKKALREEMEHRIEYHTEAVTKAQRILARLNGGGTA